MASETSHTRSETVTVRDTVLKIAPDSATLLAMMECDSANQVLVRLLDITEGERLRYAIDMDTVGSSLLVRLRCAEDSIRELAQLRERTVTDSVTVTKTVTVEVEKPKSSWSGFLEVCGWILIGVVGLGLITTIIVIVCKICKKG